MMQRRLSTISRSIMNPSITKLLTLLCLMLASFMTNNAFSPVPYTNNRIRSSSRHQQRLTIEIPPRRAPPFVVLSSTLANNELNDTAIIDVDASNNKNIVDDREEEISSLPKAPIQDNNSGRDENENGSGDVVVNVVLVTGFESFNRDLYEEAGRLLPPECKVNLKGKYYTNIIFTCIEFVVMPD